GEIDTSKQDFNRWVLAVGNGTLPAKVKEGKDEPTWIDILEKFLIKTWDCPIEKLWRKHILILLQDGLTTDTSRRRQF
ncbi:hypothetical protein Tco_1171819, partial [Tanacetum coccineum]